MLTKLRRQVQAHLAAVSVRRKPALRRAGTPDALLATDLPLAADDASVVAFTSAMEADGWRVWSANGWLLLDHSIPAPAAIPITDMPGEIGCCLWLLRRHPGGDVPADMLRTLVKAAEDGTLEKLCAAWHRDFARMLREGIPLPGGLLPYLAQALRKEEQA